MNKDKRFFRFAPVFIGRRMESRGWGAKIPDLTGRPISGTSIRLPYVIGPGKSEQTQC
jgi:hypothetical protein